MLKLLPPGGHGKGNSVPRYALFYAPDKDDPLNEAATQWLGRDAFTSKRIKRSSLVPGLDDEAFEDHLTSARRYGFHGTLKAPFALAPGYNLDALEDALESWCARHEPFALPAFKVGRLGRFFALLPTGLSTDLSGLAASLVRAFDPFRAPLSEADIARRNPDRLSQSQRDNLMAWGYPYIFEDFRFHMTLTDPVEDTLAPAFDAALNTHFKAALATPRQVSAICLFVEPERGSPFTIHRQIPLG